MKFNTLVRHKMQANVHEWYPQTSAGMGNVQGALYYRFYHTTPIVLPCTIFINAMGNLQLVATEQMQLFAVVKSMQDAYGKPFMEDQWYTVQRVFPIFDASGATSGYRHNLALLAPEVLEKPINPPKEYPEIDQAP